MCRNLAVLAVFAALLGQRSGDLLAQGVVVSGRVLRGGAAERPLVGAWVVMHQVSMDGGGKPVDSTRTDARGAFTLAGRRADSAAIYVVRSEEGRGGEEGRSRWWPD